MCVCAFSRRRFIAVALRARVGPLARSVRDQPPTLPPPHPYVIMTAILARRPANPSHQPSSIRIN